MIVKTALTEFAANSARAFVARGKVVGASELGACERRTWYAKHHAPTNDNHRIDWGPALRGSVFEGAAWVPAMQARCGERLQWAGDDQRSFESGYLRATPDAIITNLTREAAESLGLREGDSILVECKTRDPRGKLAAPKPEHVFQVQAQLGLVRERINHKPTHALISYTDASDWSEVAEFLIPFDPSMFAAAKQRATRIMEAKAAVELQPEGYITNSGECSVCPYSHAC